MWFSIDLKLFRTLFGVENVIFYITNLFGCRLKIIAFFIAVLLIRIKIMYAMVEI
jgi:hypothetical protein